MYAPRFYALSHWQGTSRCRPPACLNVPALSLLATYVATTHYLTQAATNTVDSIAVSTSANLRIPPGRRQQFLWRVPAHQVAPSYTEAKVLTRLSPLHTALSSIVKSI